MDHQFVVGTYSSVSRAQSSGTTNESNLALLSSNATQPRCASSSKDGTVKVWSPAQSFAEFTLAGHNASVNVVRWGGEGLIYTGSSDRTIKIWSAKDVSKHRRVSSRVHLAYTAGSLRENLSEL